MSPEEKQISFMNRYFAFRKVRDVDVKKMAHLIIKDAEFDSKQDEESAKELEKEVKKKEEEKGEAEPVKKRSRLVLKKETQTVPTVSISKEKMFITLKKK
jgi:hypothetical protein